MPSKKDEAALLISGILADLSALEELQKRKGSALTILSSKISGSSVNMMSQPRTNLHERPTLEPFSGSNREAEQTTASLDTDTITKLCESQESPGIANSDAPEICRHQRLDPRELDFYFWARKLAIHFEQVISRTLLHEGNGIGWKADSLYQDYVNAKAVEAECSKKLDFHCQNAERFVVEATALSQCSTADILLTDSESDDLTAEKEYGTDEDDQPDSEATIDPSNLQSFTHLLAQLRTKADEETSVLFKWIYEMYFRN